MPNINSWPNPARQSDPEGYIHRAIVTHLFAGGGWLRRARLVVCSTGGCLPRPPPRRARRDVVRLLATLPPRQWAVIVLLFDEDLTEVEVAGVL